MKGILGLILLFIAPQVLAGPFDPPPTDKSLEILGMIFGGTVGDIYLGGQSNQILYRLIEKFNFVIIAAGALIVSYVTVQSITHTAHEGEMLGARKTRWSALWIPIRSIVGMSLLVPTPATGYCLVQVAVVWIVVQGVGVADIMWKIALDGLSSGVSASAGTMTNSNLQPIGEQIGLQLLNGAICMQSVMDLADPNGNSYVYRYGNMIKNFTEQKTYPTTGDKFKIYKYGIADGVPYASVSGTSYFGFDNDSLPQPDAKKVCGSFNIDVTVRLDEYSKDIQTMFLGSNPSQARLMLEQALNKAADAANLDGYSEDIHNMLIGPDASMTPAELEKFLADSAQYVYEIKLKAISAMMQKIQPIASGMVNGAYTSPIEPNSALPSPPPGLKRELGEVYAQYMSLPVVPEYGSFNTLSNVPSASEIDSVSDVIDAAGTVVSNVITISTATITDFRKSTMDAITGGAKSGWITAGSYYFILNKTLVGVQFDSATDPYDPTQYKIPSCDDPESSCYQAVTRYNVGVADNAKILNDNLNPDQDQTLVAMNLAKGYRYYARDVGRTTSKLNFAQGESEAGGEITEIMNSVEQATSQILNVMSSIFTGSLWKMDPLVAHAKFGRIIMSACESVWIATAKKPWSKVTKLFSDKVFSAKSILWNTIFVVIFGLMWIILPVIAFLWAFGALLAVYCPLIPFLFFTVGALGWYIIVVEAVIGAPIIAIGLITPGGDALGRISGSLMILGNIFFRPVLMIFGFLLAGRIYRAVVQLIDGGMGSIFLSLNITTLFSVVVIVALYVSFILSATNVCFSIIYELPNKIFRWLGGQEEKIALAEIGELKGVVQDAGHEMGSFIKETSKSGLKSSLGATAKAIRDRFRGGGSKE